MALFTPEEQTWAYNTFVQQPKNLYSQASNFFGNYGGLFQNRVNEVFNPRTYDYLAQQENLYQQQRVQDLQKQLEQNYKSAIEARNKTTEDQKDTTTGGGGGGGGGDAGKQYGGWYWRPELGKAMRWFNGVWTDGEEPGGQPLSSDVASLIPAAPEIAPFNFDWNRAELDALDKLRPYYEEIIAEAQGDMDLAIKRLTEDYDTGVRYANENWQFIQERVNQDYYIADRIRQENLTTNTGRTLEDMYREKRLAEEDAATQTAEAQRLEPQEKAATLEAVNKRGVLESSIRTNEQTDLEARQAARREAINTALARREQATNINAARGTSDLNQAYQRQVEQADMDKMRTLQEADVNKARTIAEATTPYQRALQDYEIQFPRYLRDLGEEKKQKAAEMASMEYQKDVGRYLTEAQQILGSYIS